MIKRPFFDSDGNSIEDGEPIFLSGKVQGGTPKFHVASEKDPNSVSVFDNKESSISKMSHDKAMMKLIRDGKAEDKGLKREALNIEKESSRKRKENWFAKKRAKIARMKREFKMK